MIIVRVFPSNIFAPNDKWERLAFHCLQVRDETWPRRCSPVCLSPGILRTIRSLKAVLRGPIRRIATAPAKEMQRKTDYHHVVRCVLILCNSPGNGRSFSERGIGAARLAQMLGQSRSGASDPYFRNSVILQFRNSFVSSVGSLWAYRCVCVTFFVRRQPVSSGRAAAVSCASLMEIERSSCRIL